MTDGLDPRTIESRIRTYESFGVHRTAWPADDATSRWLLSELEAAGIDATLERFEFPRVEWDAARLRWAGGSAEGVPLYDGGFTPPGGIEGQLAASGDDVFGRIVVVTAAEAAGGRLQGARFYDMAQGLREAGAIGLVIVAGDRDGHVRLRNAERIDAPLALPALQLAPKDVPELAPAVLVGAEATLEIDGRRLRSTATNVTFEMEGTEPGVTPVGVVTPKSGWFGCAAERGGGIAVWLALAEALAKMPERVRPVHFVATAGHELGHSGFAAHLAGRPPLAADARAWLHLGASIGAREPRAVVECNEPWLTTVMNRALDEAGVGPYATAEATGGEAQNIADAGGLFISFRGGHAFFHTPNDTVDRAVDAESVARYARASLRIVQAMIAS